MKRRKVFRRAPDRGASAIEWAILTPIMVSIILFAVQFVMIYHARHVALAAAQAGDRVARQLPDDGDWQGKAEQKARDSVLNFGPDLLTGMTAVASDGADGGGGYSRAVVVEGWAKVVIPGFRFRIVRRSEGPIECFRPDQNDSKLCEDEAG